MYFGFIVDVSGRSRTFEETKRLFDFVKNELFHSGFIYKNISVNQDKKENIYVSMLILRIALFL